MLQKLKPYKTLLIFFSLGIGIAAVSIAAFYFLRTKNTVKLNELNFYDADGNIVNYELKPDWKVFLYEYASPTIQQKLEILASESSNTANNPEIESLEDVFSFCDREFPTFSYSNIFNQEIISLAVDTSNASINKAVINKAEKQMLRSTEILKGRLTKVGFPNAEIKYNKQAQSIRIIVGPLKRFDDFKTFIIRPAQLNFWETYSNHEIMNAFVQADLALKQHLFPDKNGASQEQIENTSDTISLKSLINEGSLAETSEQAKWAAARRENPLRVYLAGGFEPRFNNNIPIHDARISYVEWKDTADLYKYLELEIIKKNFPKDAQFYFGDADAETKKLKLSILYCIKTVFNGNKPLISGDQVESARLDYDQITGSPCISLEMNLYGSKVWERMTGNNINHPIAMVLDGKVLSAPAPTEKISGGRSNISGSYTVNEAYELATLLNLGALPLKLKIIKESVER